MWDGVLHMNPPPIEPHMRVGGDLFLALSLAARAKGLRAYIETGLFDPKVKSYKNYRVPDMLVTDPRLATRRGIDGPAELVVEVRSPGDDTDEKLPYYAHLGVPEVMILNSFPCELEHLRLVRGAYQPVATPADGWHRVLCVDVALRVIDEGVAFEMDSPLGLERLEP